MCLSSRWIAANLVSDGKSVFGRISPRTLASLLLPTALAAAVILSAQDPTYRFPVLVVLLPSFLRGAAVGLDLAKPRDRASLTRRVFSTIGFAAFIVGWLLTFAVIGFVIGAALFPQAQPVDLLKQSMLFAAAGLVLAAWFFWPWYARDVLANWPRRDVRIWTSSGNRWDKVSTAWRVQQLAASGGIRWRGFGATALVVVLVTAASAAGVYDGLVARGVEVGALLLLAVLHLVIVHEADALCGRWLEGTDAD